MDKNTPCDVGGYGGPKILPMHKTVHWLANPLDYYIMSKVSPALPEDLDTGTIGVVARDAQGRLAAAHFNWGTCLGKCKDGSGTALWRERAYGLIERVAVSCTGQGEFFIKAAIAADISARMRYGNFSLKEASQGAIDDMGVQGGYGGVIALGTDGIPVFPYNSQGMRRGWIDKEGQIRVDV